MRLKIISLFIIIFISGCFTNIYAGTPPDKKAVSKTTAPSPSVVQQKKVMTDINDINPPEQAGFNKKILFWTLGAAGILILICALIFLFDYFFRRKKSDKNNKSIPLPPPDVEAMNRLLMLKNTANCDDRNFYFTLTSILKRYIERRFSVEVMDKTTQEIIPVIRGLSLDKTLISGIRELFNHSDPVKYAKFSVEESRRKEDIKFAGSFIDNTKPATETQDEINVKPNTN